MAIVLDALLVEQGCDGPWPFISGLFVQLLTRSEAFSMLRFQDSLKAMADKKRLDILAALREAPRSSGELADITGLSAATVTHHMQILLNASLVGLELRGARSIYSLKPRGRGAGAGGHEGVLPPGAGLRIRQSSAHPGGAFLRPDAQPRP